MAAPTVTPTTQLIPRTRRVTLNSPVAAGNTALGILKSIHESLKKIEILVRSNTSLQKQQTEQQRRQKITQTRQQQEQQAETPKLINPLKYLQGALPKTGFLESIRNFILYTFMGFAFTKLVRFLPKVLSTLKFIDPFIKFTENFVGSVFKNFVNAIDLGYEQYDKVRSLAKQVSGEKFEKQFDELSSTLNKFLNTAIIVGFAIAGSGAVGGGGKKLPTRVVPKPGTGTGAGSTRLNQYFSQTRAQDAITKKYGFDGARLYQDKINRGSTPAQALSAVKQRFSQRTIPTGGLAGKGRTAGNIGARGLGNVQQRASLKLLGKGGAKLLGKVPIIGPIADFLISTLIFKERPDRAAAGAVGGAVGATLGSFPALIPFGGPIWGGILGDIVGRSLFDATSSMQGQGEKIQKKAAGGQITRGGRSVNRTASRTLPRKTRRLQRSKQQLPQPGQNVGGLKQIKKVFSSPKKPGKKNPLRALKNISEIMNRNRDPLFGGIMVATSNLPLGQKPDPLLGQEIKNNFASLIDNAIAAQSSKEVNQIQRSIVAAAEGGVIPASRTLRTGPTIGEQLGAAISRSFQNALNSRTNEIFQSLKREMTLKGEEPEGRITPGLGEGGDIIVTSDSPDFWLLTTAALFEGVSAQGYADVAQAIYNRVSMPGDPWKTGGSIRNAILNPSQFQPVRERGGVSVWSRITDKQSAIDYVQSQGRNQAQLEAAASALLNTTRQRSARDFVGPRDSFRSYSYEDANNHLADETEVRREGHAFGFEPKGATIGKFKAGQLRPAEINRGIISGTVTAAGGGNLIQVGKWILQQGFTVGENKFFTNNAWPKFEPNPGGFNPKGNSPMGGHASADHATNAFDVTDHRGQPPQNKGEIARLTSLFIHLYKNRNSYGIKALIYDHYGYWFAGQPSVTGGKYDGNHYDHLHVGFSRGVYDTKGQNIELPNQPQLQPSSQRPPSPQNQPAKNQPAKNQGVVFKDGKFIKLGGGLFGSNQEIVVTNGKDVQLRQIPSFGLGKGTEGQIKQAVDGNYYVFRGGKWINLLAGGNASTQNSTPSSTIAKAQFTPLSVNKPDIAKDSIASNPDVITNTLILSMVPTA